MGTIADKLNYLNTTKTNIKNAIIAKGVAVSDNDTFRSYATKISDIPILDSVEELTVTQNGTYTGTGGVTYNPVTVDIDDTDLYRDTTDSTYESVKTLSNCGAFPMLSLKAEINAVQDLHGYDKPWVGGSGKNKFDADTLYASYKQSDGSYRMGIAPAFTTHYNIPSSLVGVACVFSGYLKLDEDVTLTNVRPMADIGGTYIDGAIITSTNYTAFTLSFTPTSTSDYICIAYGGGGGIIQMKELQLESGSTATTFEPYSNICPISGWDEANVVVSPTTDAEDGTTYNIEFTDGTNPLTVYGGSLNVVSGELKVAPYYASYNGETLEGEWISDRDAYAVGTTPTIGAQVVNIGATPQTYQLTPTQVNALLGTNNLWADTGDVGDVRYFKKVEL